MENRLEVPIDIDEIKYQKIKTNVQNGVRRSTILKEFRKDFRKNQVKRYWTDAHLQILLVNALYFLSIPIHHGFSNMKFISVVHDAISVAWTLAIFIHGFKIFSLFNRCSDFAGHMKIQIRRIEQSQNYQDYKNGFRMKKV
jgi:hypothetical protein